MFLLCFLVYFTTYLGRLNYTAALSEIIAEGSLLGAMIIPAFNLLGVYLAGVVNKKLFHNELVTSRIFFSFAGFLFSFCGCVPVQAL